MVIATHEPFLQIAAYVVLHHRRASKFTAPDYQRLVEQTALLQVRQQTSDSAINLLALDRQRFIDALARR